jgi:hypothetical protein
MAHKWALDAVERLLRDIRQNDAPFGGVTMLFAGDMQQLLPVHRFARDPAAYCFKTCAWYGCTVPLQLTLNVRWQLTMHAAHSSQLTHHGAHRAINDPVWAAFVAGIGKGQPAVFPASCVVPDVNALIEAVWPGGSFMCDDNRGILTMTREDAASINKRVMDAFVGTADVALSLDTASVIVCVVFALLACVFCVCSVCSVLCVCIVFAWSAVWTDRRWQDCDPIHYPIEFVNSISLSGIPDHVLILKKGAPYIVMHNTSAALCNGTRIVYLRRIGRHFTVYTTCIPMHNAHVTFGTSPRLLHSTRYSPHSPYCTQQHHTAHNALNLQHQRRNSNSITARMTLHTPHTTQCKRHTSHSVYNTNLRSLHHTLHISQFTMYHSPFPRVFTLHS